MASGLLSVNQVKDEQLMLLLCFELFNRFFLNTRGQMQAVLKKLAGLLEPPNLQEDIRLHMKKQKTSMDAVLASPVLASNDDLARHIEGMSAVVFIHQAAHVKYLDAELTAVYQVMEDKVVIVIKDLPGAL